MEGRRGQDFLRGRGAREKTVKTFSLLRRRMKEELESQDGKRKRGEKKFLPIGVVESRPLFPFRTGRLPIILKAKGGGGGKHVATFWKHGKGEKGGSGCLSFFRKQKRKGRRIHFLFFSFERGPPLSSLWLDRRCQGGGVFEAAFS